MSDSELVEHIRQQYAKWYYLNLPAFPPGTVRLDESDEPGVLKFTLLPTPDEPQPLIVEGRP